MPDSAAARGARDHLDVAARVASGSGSWHAWQATDDYATWAAASGAADSLAAGAVVLGYYLVDWLGVRRRLGRVLRS